MSYSSSRQVEVSTLRCASYREWAQKNGLLASLPFIFFCQWTGRMDLNYLISLRQSPFWIQRKKHSEEISSECILYSDGSDFCCGTYSTGRMLKLEQVQRRTLRMMNGWKNMVLTKTYSSNTLSNKRQACGDDPRIINKQFPMNRNLLTEN